MHHNFKKGEKTARAPAASIPPCKKRFTFLLFCPNKLLPHYTLKITHFIFLTSSIVPLAGRTAWVMEDTYLGLGARPWGTTSASVESWCIVRLGWFLPGGAAPQVLLTHCSGNDVGNIERQHRRSHGGGPAAPTHEDHPFWDPGKIDKSRKNWWKVLWFHLYIG